MIPFTSEQISWLMTEADKRMVSEWGEIPNSVNKQTFKSAVGLMGLEVWAAGKPGMIRIVYGEELA